MLINLTPIIHHGIIDNTTQGTVRLLLWCVGEAEPIPLEMPGNCLQDIAGCRVEFRLRKDDNTEEPPPPLRTLRQLAHSHCSGEEPPIAGDMTLSRRFPLPQRPRRLANILSLEFFPGVRTRCIIETDEFEYTLSLPEWACSAAAAGAQEIINMAALHDHVLANVAAFRGPACAHVGTAEMPACRWDFALNRAEAYMLIAPSIRAKYAGRPGGDMAEAFVLDRLLYLHRAAEHAEQGEAVDPLPHWEVLDFLKPSHAKLARRAMHHPLFDATAELSLILKKHVLAKLSQYENNKEVNTLLSSYAGIITHVLATIMLASEGQAQVASIISRAETLCKRMQLMMKYGESLQPEAHSFFMQGAEVMLARLREFLCTLRQ